MSFDEVKVAGRRRVRGGVVCETVSVGGGCCGDVDDGMGQGKVLVLKWML